MFLHISESFIIGLLGVFLLCGKDIKFKPFESSIMGYYFMNILEYKYIYNWKLIKNYKSS